MFSAVAGNLKHKHEQNRFEVEDCIMTHKLIGTTALMIMLIIPLMISCGQKQEQQQSEADQRNEVKQGETKGAPATQDQKSTIAIPETAPLGFADVEKRLTDTLLALWSANGNVTSVDQAAKMLGIEVTDSMRAELLTKLGGNLAMSKRLTHYRAYTFILTNQEKLIAQYITIQEKKDSEFPTLKRIASDLKVSESEVSKRLKFLAYVGYLYPLGGVDEYNKLGYSYGTKAADFAFDMGLRFHQFSVDNQVPFNVGCAKEAYYVVASQYPRNKIRYDTVDPLTLTPIEVVFKDEQIVSISPDSACFLEGGSCGANNLFASRANATAWAKTMPQLARQAPPIYDIKERFDKVIEDLKQTPTGGN